MFFFISASQISHMIQIYNINFDAETEESQMPFKIKGLNNYYMLGKRINIFSFYVQSRLVLFLLQYTF